MLRSQNIYLGDFIVVFCCIVLIVGYFWMPWLDPSIGMMAQLGSAFSSEGTIGSTNFTAHYIFGYSEAGVVRFLILIPGISILLLLSTLFLILTSPQDKPIMPKVTLVVGPVIVLCVLLSALSGDLANGGLASVYGIGFWAMLFAGIAIFLTAFIPVPEYEQEKLESDRPITMPDRT